MRHLQRRARQDHAPVCPKVLGIDEHFFTHNKGYATTFCDLKNHRIYRVAVRVIGVPVIEIRPEAARIRTGPHEQADPLHVGLAREMPQSTVGLGLERIREFGARLFVVDEGPERTLDLLMERDQESSSSSVPTPQYEDVSAIW